VMRLLAQCGRLLHVRVITELTITEIELVVRQFDKLIGGLGETRVALGSDFDGAVVPREIGSVAGMQSMYQALRRHGYDTPLLNKLGWENWISALERTFR
jgi:membrane dipeptidase